jgi:hypothetical protein
MFLSFPFYISLSPFLCFPLSPFYVSPYLLSMFLCVFSMFLYLCFYVSFSLSLSVFLSLLLCNPLSLRCLSYSPTLSNFFAQVRSIATCVFRVRFYPIADFLFSLIHKSFPSAFQPPTSLHNNPKSGKGSPPVLFSPGENLVKTCLTSSLTLLINKLEPGNTKGGSMTVLLASCLTGLESAV